MLSRVRADGDSIDQRLPVRPKFMIFVFLGSVAVFVRLEVTVYIIRIRID
jgi:hypothetical protein